MDVINFKTPAGRFIQRFGAKQLAVWTGRHPSRVHAWTWPSDRGGTGGVIPIKVRAAIIKGAAADLNQPVAWAEFEPQAGEAYIPAPAKQGEPA